MKKREKKNGSLYRGYKLFLSENGLEVVRVDCGVASILLFRINISLSSKSVWFGAQTTRMEPDNKVELEEILRLPCLLLDQYLGSRKILKVLIIHNNVDGIGQTFQIVSPNLEGFKDSKQFFVMYVIIQLHCSKSAGVKNN